MRVADNLAGSRVLDLHVPHTRIFVPTFRILVDKVRDDGRSDPVRIKYLGNDIAREASKSEESGRPDIVQLDWADLERRHCRSRERRSCTRCKVKPFTGRSERYHCTERELPCILASTGLIL